MVVGRVVLMLVMDLTVRTVPIVCLPPLHQLVAVVGVINIYFLPLAWTVGLAEVVVEPEALIPVRVEKLVALEPQIRAIKEEIQLEVRQQRVLAAVGQEPLALMFLAVLALMAGLVLLLPLLVLR